MGTPQLQLFEKFYVFFFVLFLFCNLYVLSSQLSAAGGEESCLFLSFLIGYLGNFMILSLPLSLSFFPKTSVLCACACVCVCVRVCARACACLSYVCMSGCR